MNELVSYGISILISCTSFLSLSTNIVHNKISSTIIPSYVPTKKRLPWVTYIYSTIHASLSTTFAILYLRNHITQSLYMHMFGFSVGYAIHDALVVWRNKRFFRNTWKHFRIFNVGCSANEESGDSHVVWGHDINAEKCFRRSGY